MRRTTEAGLGVDALSAFGETVRALRQIRSLSQEELAAMADLDRTYLGGVERGERNVSLRNIVRIASALGVQPAALLKDVKP